MCKRAETQIFRQTRKTLLIADTTAAANAKRSVCFLGDTFFLRDKLLEQLEVSITLHLHSHAAVLSCTENQERCGFASQNCSQWVVTVLVSDGVLLCITAASVPVVTKDAADCAAVTVLTGVGRAMLWCNRLSGTRDNFLSAEKSHSLGGCRSCPGFPCSMNVLQGWGGFHAAFAGARVLTTPTAHAFGI